MNHIKMNRIGSTAPTQIQNFTLQCGLVVKIILLSIPACSESHNFTPSVLHSIIHGEDGTLAFNEDGFPH